MAVGYGMQLARLEVHDFRVVKTASLDLHSRLNIFVGTNGAGKTSLLEALHLLGTGRSFRSRDVEKVIRWGARELSVFGEGVDRTGARRRLGVVKGRLGGRIRLDGQDERGMASMARVLPLAVFGPESLDLVQGAPDRRRSLVDWTLFHVEQGYAESLHRYRRALKQRNATLRMGGRRREARVWEEELAEEAQRLDLSRQQYVREVEPHVECALAGMGPGPLEINYRRGWSQEDTLQEALERSWETDCGRGWTSPGPHGADLLLRLGRRHARDALSRGEKKILVAALVLGHVAYIRERCGSAPVVLADDIPSELDERGRKWFIERLVLSNSQIFTTTLGRELLPLPLDVEHKVFHVEQGVITNLL